MKAWRFCCLLIAEEHGSLHEFMHEVSVGEQCPPLSWGLKIRLPKKTQKILFITYRGHLPCSLIHTQQREKNHRLKNQRIIFFMGKVPEFSSFIHCYACRGNNDLIPYGLEWNWCRNRTDICILVFSFKLRIEQTHSKATCWSSHACIWVNFRWISQYY